MTDATEETPSLPTSGLLKTTLLMKPAQSIKLEVTITELNALLKLNAETAYLIKDAGLKKTPKSTELMNTEL